MKNWPSSNSSQILAHTIYHKCTVYLSSLQRSLYYWLLSRPGSERITDFDLVTLDLKSKVNWGEGGEEGKLCWDHPGVTVWLILLVVRNSLQLLGLQYLRLGGMTQMPQYYVTKLASKNAAEADQAHKSKAWEKVYLQWIARSG